MIIGLDVSAHRVDVCWLESQVEIPLRDFYESPDFKMCHAQLNKSNHSISFIQSLNPDVCILEPTGVYSKFWIDNFERLGISYLLVNQTIVKDTRKALGGSSNKDDPFDALIMCDLYFEKYLKRFDRRFWIRDRGNTIKEIAKTLNELNGVIKRQTQAVNGAKQRLSYEFPKKAAVRSRRDTGNLDPNIPPAWWAWVAGVFSTPTWELRAQQKTMFEREYQEAMERHEGSGLSELTRQYARMVCHWHTSEALLEQELIGLLTDEDFQPYHKIFDRFGFGYRERGWLLTRIYPFEGFLGVPKFRSKRRFRQALGCGKVTSQSGQSSSVSKKSTGAAQIHSLLIIWVTRCIEKGMAKRLLDFQTPKITKWDCSPNTPECKEIRGYFIRRAYNPDTLNKKAKLQLLGAKSATARKTAEVLFKALYDDWCKRF